MNESSINSLITEGYLRTQEDLEWILKNANLWATEMMNNAKYPLELFQRIITVCLEIVKIVKALPKLEID